MSSVAEFAKRPEITVSTMGRVHNPTGEGVRAISSQAQAKAAKHSAKTETATPPVGEVVTTTTTTTLDTKTKDGTDKRNITRKKTADKVSGNYNSAHKKQGGHGKGEWKEVMDPTYATERLDLDENDPLYIVSEDNTKYVLTSTGHENASKRGYDPETSKPIFGPMLTMTEFKLQLADIVKEYFDSCDAEEFIRSLEELGCHEYHAEVVKKAISLAMDKGSREREWTSRLLTCLHPNPLSEADMEAGFVLLLDSIDDLCTDVPEAKTMVASFMARAVVDEVLPPAFMSDQNNSRPGDPVVEKAVTSLSREHCTARLEKVWGPGDGRPVEDLKKEMDHLLREYLASRELDEAARCVKELEAPHFHHELVKRGVVCAMDGSDASLNLDAMAALVDFLVQNAIISDNQVKKGLSRLHARLPDLKLDVPQAPELLESFEKYLSDARAEESAE